MVRNKLVILCGLIFTTMLGANAFGQKVHRIIFKRDATKAVVTGKLNGYKGEDRYVIRLRAGQTLSVDGGNQNNRDNHYVTISVTSPAGEDMMDYAADCHSKAEVKPTVAGDYKISVFECQKADPWRGIYKLTVKAR